MGILIPYCIPTQLPNSSCTFNYTLLIEDGRDAAIKRLGPFPHTGSAVVKLDIAISDLKRNHLYSLTAQAHLYSQVTLSNIHHFSKAYSYYFSTSSNTIIIILS